MSTLALPTVRQSFLARADQCMLSAKLDREAPAFTTHPQARGSVFHEFVWALLRELVERREHSLSQNRAAELMGEVAAASDLPLTSVEHAEMIELARAFVENRGFPIDDLIDVEETCALDVDGYRVTGKPDMVLLRDGVCEIWDWKTSWAVAPESQVAGTFQLRLYARLVAAQYPYIRRWRLVMEYPRWGDHGFREAFLDHRDIDLIDRQVRALLGRLGRAEKSGEWEATPGPWCVTCARPDACPIPLECRADGAVTTAELALAYARQITTMDAILRRRRKALRAWCDEHGPVIDGGVEFAFHAKADSQQCIDKDALRAATDKAGVVWETHFKTVKGGTEFRARKVTA